MFQNSFSFKFHARNYFTYFLSVDQKYVLNRFNAVINHVFSPVINLRITKTQLQKTYTFKNAAIRTTC